MSSARPLRCAPTVSVMAVVLAAQRRQPRRLDWVAENMFTSRHETHYKYYEDHEEHHLF